MEKQRNFCEDKTYVKRLLKTESDLVCGCDGAVGWLRTWTWKPVCTAADVYSALFSCVGCSFLSCTTGNRGVVIRVSAFIFVEPLALAPWALKRLVTHAGSVPGPGREMHMVLLLLVSLVWVGVLQIFKNLVTPKMLYELVHVENRLTKNEQLLKIRGWIWINLCLWNNSFPQNQNYPARETWKGIIDKSLFWLT